jgi:pyridoxal biosynthesis lyase PdxS
MSGKKKLSLLSLYERAGKDMFDKEFEYTKEERGAFMEAVKNYEAYGEVIRGSEMLGETIKEISELVELAGGFTLKETDGWFDNVTATRHVKQMKEAVKVLQKEAQEIMSRQQRLEAAYEDVGSLLGRYYDV